MDEYRKYIEKDAALERRFQPVQVNEPTEDETIEILNGIKDKYEVHHKVIITEEAIKAAVKLSVRYITDRFLPDKAIDLIDEACSKVRLESHTSPKDVKALEAELEKLNIEKVEAIQAENYEGAAEIKKKTDEIKVKLEAAQEDWKNRAISIDQIVTPERIAQIIASWTGIPVVKLAEEEGQRLMQMEETLHKRVIGQDEAVVAVSEAIRRGRVGLKDPKRPVGSFLFLGPTGVGKTELCKALAEVLFGKEDSMIRIDMSEYMEKHSVSRLIGSPPGYVGYDDAPQLSEKVRKKPYSVILFDEIEKAHPDVFNILLQILDDGRITDSHGRIVDFKNTVIIMTSNVGARNITEPKKMGFGTGIDETEKYKDMKHLVMEEVKNSFRPEFLNRIDDIIVFHALNQEHTREIVTLLTNELAKRVKDSMNIIVDVTDTAKDLLGTEGYSPMYGARPLKRLIQTKVENKLANLILRGIIKPNTTVTIDVKDSELTFN
jgi:ATP-dependent Clp protease ATP-binding subunit ClpC